MDFFYREKPWYAGQFVRKISHKEKITKNVSLFLSVILNSQRQRLLSVLVRDVDKTFLKSEIHLPVKANGTVDYDFMERFITELEVERIAKLDAYLSAANLKDCILTVEEQKALDDFDNIEWGNFRLDLLFEKLKTKKLPFKAEDLPKNITDQCTLPCLTSSFNNQGLNYFAPKNGATILKKVISIPANSDVYRAYFQPHEFTVLSDAYAIQWIFDGVELSPNQYLFAVQCINKVTNLPVYSYKNKLGGWNVVKNKSITLPVMHGKPDYETMNTLISAMKKLAVKDVVQYADRKIQIAKKAITEDHGA